MGVLVLGRKKGQRVLIGNNIIVTVIKIGTERVTLGFEAPDDVSIYREELLNDKPKQPTSD